MTRADAERRLILTCEHASNRVPAELARLFRGERALLATHRGWDPGALEVAQGLARRLRAPLVAGEATRLVVDLNRSPHNRAVFSKFTRDLPRPARETLLARYHAPHWARVERLVARARRPVVHVAIHSFTPVLGDDVRDFELGLLYDPQRPRERRFMEAVRASVAERAPALRVRRNAPYRGTSDGLPTAFRRARRPADYLGLELELNQAVLGRASERRDWVELLAPVLREALIETS